MHTVLRLAFVVVVVTFALEMGLSVPRERLRATVRAIGPLLRGTVLLLFVAPLLATAIVALLDVPRPFSTAIIATAATGLVPLAPRQAGKVGGDVAYAEVLTALVGVLAIFTAPYLVVRLIHYTGGLHLDAPRLVLQLVLLQVVPFALGLWLGKSHASARLLKVLRVVNGAALVVVIALAIVPRLGVLRAVGLRELLAVLALSFAVAGLGYAFGAKEHSRRRALLGMVNAPNVALTMAMVTMAGSDASPQLPAAVSAAFLLRILCGLGVRALSKHRDPAAAHADASAPISDTGPSSSRA